MPYLVHLLLGTFISFFAAMPLGPVNLAIVQTALKHGRFQAILVALGSSLVELIYCLLAVWGMDILFKNQQDQEVFMMVLKLLSTPLILSLGVFNLMRYVKTDEEEAEGRKATAHGGLLLGFSLNLFNPMLLPFWLMVTAYLRGQEFLGGSLSLLFTYSIGVMLGTFLLQLSVALIAARKHQGMTYQGKVRATRIVGWLFLGLGLYVTFLTLKDMYSMGWL